MKNRMAFFTRSSVDTVENIVDNFCKKPKKLMIFELFGRNTFVLLWKTVWNLWKSPQNGV